MRRRGEGAVTVLIIHKFKCHRTSVHWDKTVLRLQSQTSLKIPGSVGGLLINKGL